MVTQKEANLKTIILFITASLILLTLTLNQIELIRTIQENSRGLIHRTLILNAILIIGSVYGILILYGKMDGKDIGLVHGQVLLSVVVGIVIWIIVQVVEGTIGYARIGTIELEPIWETDSIAVIGLLLGMLFGNALYEEIAFRGFLLIQFKMKLERKIKNKVFLIAVALFMSQAVFVLFHIPWKVTNRGWTTSVFFELFFVFVNGVIYGLLYLRTKNLFFVMIVHALGNAPTSLIKPFVSPSSLILLLAIVCAAIWPKLRKMEMRRLTQHERRRG